MRCAWCSEESFLLIKNKWREKGPRAPVQLLERLSLRLCLQPSPGWTCVPQSQSSSPLREAARPGMGICSLVHYRLSHWLLCSLAQHPTHSGLREALEAATSGPWRRMATLVHLSSRPLTHSPTPCSPTHPSTCPATHPSAHPLTHTTHPSIHPLAHVLIHSGRFHPCICPFIHSSTAAPSLLQSHVHSHPQKVIWA